MKAEPVPSFFFPNKAIIYSLLCGVFCRKMYYMITIQRTVNIPADRRLTVDIPLEVPTGTTSVVLSFPQEGTSEAESPAREPWIPLVSWLQKRREERFRRAVMRVAGCLANSPAFEGDAVEVIRKMRDEWDVDEA
jgi:hypothetical protein